MSHDLKERLEERNRQLRYALRAARMGTWSWDLIEGVVEWSPETLAIFGIDSEDFGGDYEAYASFATPEALERIDAVVRAFLEAADETAEIRYQHPIIRGDGRQAWIEVRGTMTKDAQGRPAHLTGVCADITERVAMEREKAALEERLRQSQRLEAVGQLAGGVAHDFNNILTAILGNVELALDLGSDPQEALQLVQSSAERAARLTRQLLAFSRRQTLSPAAVDLDSSLDSLEPMLRLLLSENISIVRERGSGLPPVFADPSQIEQIIVNLAVNACDAMARGGLLVLATSTATLDEHYVATHPEVLPGFYVLLTVADTGAGMSPDVVDHIFEPFFTTKGPGQGTGLGLATVYGIVKQSHGHIAVYSEPGHGTTFEVYLPAHQGVSPTPSVPQHDPAAAELLRGTETILMAEDDAAVRRLATRMLTAMGYTVLSARDGLDALRIFEEHDGPLHLLVTDVIMPDRNGRELAEALQERLPSLPVLYVSGYTANVIAHQRIVDEGIEFLHKPFDRKTFLRRVRHLLDR